jgi:hypothetical protein
MPTRISGVYRITCRPTGKFYIGSSADIQSRWNAHRSDLKRRDHDNHYLQRAWDKYGEADFLWEVVEIVSGTDILIAREDHWIGVTNCCDPAIGFNQCPIAGTTKGIKRTAEFKATVAHRRADAWVVTTPEGEEIEVVNLTDFCRSRGLDVRKLHQVAIGKAGIYRGWGCRKAGTTRDDWERSRRDNSKSLKRNWILTAPDGTVHRVTGLTTFCRERGLEYKLMYSVGIGYRPHHKGWTCRPAETTARE